MKRSKKNQVIQEGEFKALIENSLDGILRFDQEFRCLYVNSRMEEQTGIPADCFIGKTIGELNFPPELMRPWKKALKKVFNCGIANRIEFQLPSGIWIDWQIIPEFSEEGKVGTVIICARDITGRKKAEESLAAIRLELSDLVKSRTTELTTANRKLLSKIEERKKEEKALRLSEDTLRHIVEGSPGFFFYICDAKGNFTYLSPSVRLITGRTLVEWTVNHKKYFTNNPINKKAIKYNKQMLQGKKSQGTYSVEIEHADGRRIFLRLHERTIFENDKVVGIQGLAHDITERRQKERELMQLSSALSGLAEMVVIMDLNHKIIYVNPASIDLLGYSPEEMVGRDSREIFGKVSGNPPDLIDKIKREAVKGVWRGEIFDRKKDGMIISVAITMTALKDEEGKVIGWVGISSDITEWKKAETELRFLSSITRQVTDAIVVTGEDYKISYINPAAEKMYGYTREELLGKTPELFNAESMADEIQKEIYQTVSSGATWQGTNLNIRKDGNTFFCECEISPLLNNRGKIISYIGILRDVTERLKLEEKLHHAQKMEAIGTLAGGIAHDFNNILAGISGYAFMAKQDTGKSNPIFSYLSAIEKLSRRGGELTKSLLSFSRRGEFQPVPVNINQVAEEVLEMVKLRTSDKYEIREEMEENLPNIAGEEGLLHQVLTNLCINAFDAMPEGGILTLTTKRVPGETIASFRSDGEEGGDLVVVKVADTGGGMDIETKERIFEPFFTTKDYKSGTGLGLSIVNGIVEKHEGWIEVESTPKVGSIFTIYFPVTNQVEKKSSVSMDNEFRGREAILLVDDDDDFRKITCAALKHFGYSVEEAKSGEDALRRLNSGGTRIDLVLLDIMMKGMGGMEALGRIKENFPGLPVIVLSGYPIDLTARQLHDAGARAFIPKPFEFTILASTVRRALKRIVR